VWESIQIAFKKAWDNFIKPMLIFIAGGIIISFAVLAIDTCRTGGDDRELDSIRSSSIAERHQIDGIYSQLRTVKDGFSELYGRFRKFQIGFDEFGTTLREISIESGDHAQQRKRIIEALRQIQKTIGGLGDA